jgi:16S rRNA processing protein RimM
VLLEVGRIVKPHGIRGEVIVDLVTNRTERVAVGSVLATPSGSLEVERSSPHQGRWIVAFAGVEDRNQAETLRGTPLSAEPIDDDEGELWVHELIGAEVVDVAGRAHGRVASVEANPASDLLVLGDGRLVPLVFVVESSANRVVVDVPAGLLD